MKLKQSMKLYFERLLELWDQTNGSLPQIPIDEQADRDFYAEVDEDSELTTWRPLEVVGVSSDWASVEALLEISLHTSIKEYFSSYWFAALGGSAHNWRVQLEPMLPGIGLSEFVRKVVGYKSTHDGELDRVPIGTEVNGSLVVVRADDGSVELEDWEAGTYMKIANSLQELIDLIHP